MFDFFNTKADQAFMDRVNAGKAAARAERVGGLSSVIDKRQAALDAYAAKINGFMQAINEHFDDAGAERFLTDAYNVTTKFDGVEVGTRNLRMKWTKFEGDLAYNLGFACVEEYKNQLRVEYISTVRTNEVTEIIERPNPDYKSGGQAVIKVYPVEDKFQTTRIYRNFDEFVTRKPKMPRWFVEMLSENIHPQ